MDISHRVAINSLKDAKFLKIINEIGIQYMTRESPGGRSSLVFFDINESDPRWKKVAELITTYKASDIADTFFTNEEIRMAKWSCLVSTFEQGYPQPKNQWPIKQLTYEDVCQKCGVHKQVRSMRIEKELHLGKRSFMSTIWCGEIFCTAEVFVNLSLIEALGYDSWDVLIHKSGQPSTKVKQLFVSGIMTPGLVVMADHKEVKCPVCGVIKYQPHMKGIMQLRYDSLLSGSDFMLSHEWFGSGLIAYREILVSNRVAQLILSTSRIGLDMVTWFLSKETKSHAQAHKRGYSNYSI